MAGRGAGAGALYTWVYRALRIKHGAEMREYIAGTAGRIKVSEARALADAMNEYSLTIGECR